MAFDNCSTESIDYVSTMTVVVVCVPAIEVFAIGMAFEILCCCSFSFNSVSMSSSTSKLEDFVQLSS